MADDNEFAAIAVDLNAEAKAKRKSRAKVADEALAAEKTAGAEAASDSDSQPEGWNAEGEHVLAVDRMEAIARETELGTSELVFDVRDFLLEIIKSRPKPWSATSQGEQRDVAAACETAANELVRKVVERIAARGVDPVRVLLTKVAMGNDIVITGKVKTFDSEEEVRAIKVLHTALNKHVMLTAASVEDYAGTPREAETDADQNDFGFEGDDGEDDYL